MSVVPEQQKPLPREVGEGLGTAGVRLKAEAETRPGSHTNLNGVLPLRSLPSGPHYETRALWLLPAPGEFGEDQLLCLLFERAPGAQLVSAAPAMNARTVRERPWELNRGRAASPARKQNAHASEDPKSPMQDRVPSERHGSTHSSWLS